MKRLHYINLIGVLALALLCVAQWKINRSLNLEIVRLDKLVQEQTLELQDQQRAAKGLATDLDTFRSQITRLNEEAQERAKTLNAAQALARQLERDRDQLRQSVTNWAKTHAELGERHKTETAQLREAVATWESAVKTRDARLKEANERIQSLGGQLNDGVARYNQLATNYNDVVERLNTLTSNYNAVVKQLNEARGAK